MKVKKIKKPRCYPYLEYKGKKGKISVTCRVFKDGSGSLAFMKNKKFLRGTSSGFLNDWYKGIEEEEKNLTIMKELLLSIDKDYEFAKDNLEE